MYRPLITLAVLAFACSAGAGAAQPVADADATKSDNGETTAAGSCVNAGRAKGFKGIDLKNFSKVCIAEAQLACLKKAIEEKQNGGRQRKQFMAACLAAAP